MAEGLVERGARVTVFSAAYPGAHPWRSATGVRYVHRGSKLTVYARGMRALPRRRLGAVDVVVDVQNGLPFFSRLVTAKPVVVLVHHVHREQWPVVYPGLTGRVGWWIERWLAPRLYRSDQYVAVSRATRGRAGRARRRPDPRIAVVHNGTDPVPGRWAAQVRAPEHLRGGAAGAPQADRARHRRGPRAARGAARPAADHRRQRLVGGGAARGTPRSAGPGHRGLHRPRRRGPQARGLRGVVGDGAALAQGGLGPRRRARRRSPAPPPSPTAPPVAPASRSSTGTRGCWPTTRRGSSRPCAGS